MTEITTELYEKKENGSWQYLGRISIDTHFDKEMLNEIIKTIEEKTEYRIK